MLVPRYAFGSLAILAGLGPEEKRHPQFQSRYFIVIIVNHSREYLQTTFVNHWQCLSPSPSLQVFVKLMRRYKYLEVMFEEEMKKVLVFIRGFTPEERTKLARMTCLWIGKDQLF